MGRTRVNVLALVIAPLGCFSPDRSSGTSDLADGTTADGSTTVDVEDPSAEASSLPGSETEVAPDESSSGAAESSSSGGEVGSCCHSGCSAESCMVGPCEDTVIGTPTMGIEALDVVTLADRVVWSTGWDKALRIADPTTGMSKELTAVETNMYITNIAADDTHVYFLDGNGGTVHRASVPVGVLDLVTVVAGGMAQDGSLAVGDEHVYVAMRGTGGLWRASKDLADQAAAIAVVASPAPVGVALDDTHVYWTDAMTQQIRRLAFADIGVDLEGTVVVDGLELGELLVRDDGVYYADAGAIRRANKDGLNESIVSFAGDQGYVLGLEIDEHDIYWTSHLGFIGRAALDSSDAPQQLVLSPSARGLALDCAGIYWLSNVEEAQSLRRLSK